MKFRFVGKGARDWKFGDVLEGSHKYGADEQGFGGVAIHTFARLNPEDWEEVKSFDYAIQISWENEDGSTDFDNFSVTAENVEQAKVLALADCEIPDQRFDLQINSVFVRVE